MITVHLERQGFQGHSFCAHGEIAGSLTLWHILKEPALEFLQRLKSEHPGLEFKARVQVVHSYVNDGFSPELTVTILSSNHLNLARSLLQQFVDTHAHLVTGQGSKLMGDPSFDRDVPCSFTISELIGLRLAVNDRLALLRSKNAAHPGSTSVVLGIENYEALHDSLNELLEGIFLSKEGAS